MTEISHNKNSKIKQTSISDVGSYKNIHLKIIADPGNIIVRLTRLLSNSKRNE